MRCLPGNFPNLVSQRAGLGLNTWYTSKQVSLLWSYLSFLAVFYRDVLGSEESSFNTVMVGNVYLKVEAFDRQTAYIVYSISDLKRESWNVETPKTSLVSQAKVASG